MHRSLQFSTAVGKDRVGQLWSFRKSNPKVKQAITLLGQGEHRESAQAFSSRKKILGSPGTRTDRCRLYPRLNVHNMSQSSKQIECATLPANLRLSFRCRLCRFSEASACAGGSAAAFALPPGMQSFFQLSGETILHPRQCGRTFGVLSGSLALGHPSLLRVKLEGWGAITKAWIYKRHGCIRDVSMSQEVIERTTGTCVQLNS